MFRVTLVVRKEQQSHGHVTDEHYLQLPWRTNQLHRAVSMEPPIDARPNTLLPLSITARRKYHVQGTLTTHKLYIQVCWRYSSEPARFAPYALFRRLCKLITVSHPHRPCITSICVQLPATLRTMCVHKIKIRRQVSPTFSKLCYADLASSVTTTKMPRWGPANTFSY
jgi:hypothetical protein